MKSNKPKAEIIKNNFYIIKEVYSLSKSRVIHGLLREIVHQCLWVFYSAYFIRFIVNIIESQPPLKEIIISISIIGLISLLLHIYINYCDNVIFPIQNVKLYQGIYQKIFRKSENVELKCYENTKFYDAFSLSLDGIGTKLYEMLDNLSRIVANIVGALAASWIMVTIDKWTLLFLIFPFIGNYIIVPRLNKIQYRRYIETIPFDRVMGYINRVMYLPEYAKEIRISRISNVLFKQYSQATIGKSLLWKKYFRGSFILGIIQMVVSFTIVFEGIFLYAAYRAIVPRENMISFGEMAVLTSVMITASWGWARAIRFINQSAQDSLLITNLKQFMTYEEKIPENQDGIIPDQEVNTIEFQNVSFSYDGKVNVINNMSFLIMKGQNLALVGHNGAGKSTLIKLLLRLYDPDTGKILINGRDIREYHLDKYRRLFACAFQDIKVFAGSIKQNVLMGRSGSDEDVINALKAVGIFELIRNLPQGIDTILTKEFDDDGVLFSGGQTQKIIVARALSHQASVVIFDEPSSALDPIAENELFNSILKSGISNIGIFISHRLSCVKNADLILTCEHGEVLESGTHKELMQNNKAYAEIYKMQEKNYFTVEQG